MHRCRACRDDGHAHDGSVRCGGEVRRDALPMPRVPSCRRGSGMHEVGLQTRLCLELHCCLAFARGLRYTAAHGQRQR